ncbi:MAG: thiamine pyrophosphate-binding protein [Syntrophales bacterium]
MEKLTDYLISFLADQGIKHIFGLTGGGVVHLFDSIDKNPHITPVYCHHEQAAALAAVSYSRITNNLGAAIVTTGPGGTNTITGVLSAWQDSIPCIFISGQARIEHTSHGKSLRQLGTQEFDILSVVKPITKYSAMVEDAKMIRYHLEKAVYLAKEGRPGPVWIDLPLNFQWAFIDPDSLKGFTPTKIDKPDFSAAYALESCEKTYDLLAKAKRPLILAGYGIRSAHAESEFRYLIGKLQIPFVSSWNASDYLPTDNKLYAGRIGIAGQRGANIAVQNCDFLLAIGSRLGIPLTGTLFAAFAREAKIIVVDIDSKELEFKTVRVDLPIHCDAKLYLENMLNYPTNSTFERITPWRQKCENYKKYNMIPMKVGEQESYINPYVFIDILSDELNNKDIIIVDGGGSNLYISFQAFKVKEGQRFATSSAIAAMGTGLPESIGACFSTNKGRTICLTGDGSLQLNIQELQTIVHHKLPIKIFVMNNDGYLAIRHTQKSFLQSNFTGSSPNGGLTLPDYQKIAKAYGLKTVRIDKDNDLLKGIQGTLKAPGPVLCEIMVSPDQELIATQGFDSNEDGTFSPRPLEDMYPFLDRKEFLENMFIKPYSK